MSVKFLLTKPRAKRSKKWEIQISIKKASVKMSLTVVYAFLVLVVSCLFLSACGGGATTYRVLLLDEDGITVLYADSVEAGTSITDIKTPTKASDEHFNYEFTGWVDDSGKDVILAFINQDITAYAKYKQVERQSICKLLLTVSL